MDSDIKPSAILDNSDQNAIAADLLIQDSNKKKHSGIFSSKRKLSKNISSNDCDSGLDESTRSQLDTKDQGRKPEAPMKHIQDKDYNQFCDKNDVVEEEEEEDVYCRKKIKVEKELDFTGETGVLSASPGSVLGVDYTVKKAPVSASSHGEPSPGRRRPYRKMAKTYFCAQCDFNSPRWDRLKEHLIVHLEDRPFVCEICHFRTKTAKKLRRHQTVHSEERKYECSLCQQAFKRAHTLKEHVLTHSKEKIFFCSECDYSTHRSQYLKRHMMKHTNEQLECPLCQFKTVYATLLRRHVQIHSDKKYYKCSICTYSTVHSHCLTQHIKNIHERDTTYKCGVCDFSTPQPSTLRTHMYVHTTGEKRHKCEFCDYSSMRKCDVKRHQSKIHKDQKGKEMNSNMQTSLVKSKRQWVSSDFMDGEELKDN